jgi:hypothetical protein
MEDPMTHENNLVTVSQFNGNAYKSSQGAELTLNAAILHAEIARSYEEFLKIHIGASKSDHLKPRTDKLLNNRRTDETCCSCDEYLHTSLLVFGIWKSKLVRRLRRRHGFFGDSIELGDCGRRESQRCSTKIFSKMVYRRCSGYEQNVGRTLKKPGKRDLHGGSLQGPRDPVEH